jgi:hypothetical protein
MRRSLLLTAGLALGALSLAAQEGKPEAKAAPAMPMPKPGPEMAKLKRMAGTWHVEESIEASPMGPAGHGHGTGKVVLGPGGLSLLIDYTSAAGHMKGYKGHGLVAWDGEAKAYKQAWADNMAPQLMLSSGNWDGDSLVMTAEGTMMGKPFKSRDTITFQKEGGYTIVTDFSLDGSPMAKMMTLVHTRLKAEAKK